MYQKKEPETSYDKFQKSKEEGMAIMASNRDATMIVCELIRSGYFGQECNAPTIKAAIKEWRKWFYVEIYETTPYAQMVQEAKENNTMEPFTK